MAVSSGDVTSSDQRRLEFACDAEAWEEADLLSEGEIELAERMLQNQPDFKHASIFLAARNMLENARE